MFCIKCGKKNSDDARFCVVCGEQLLVNSAVSPVAAEPSPKKSNLAKSKVKLVAGIVIGFFLLASAIVLGCSIINYSHKDQVTNTGDDREEALLYAEETLDISSNSETSSITENESAESEKQPTADADSVSEQDEIIPMQNAYSIWGDGIECRVVRYLDERSMLVKIPFGNYIVQAVLPREFENGFHVDSEFYEDENGEINDAYLELVDVSENCAVRLVYMCGTGYSAECQELTFENLQEKVAEYDEHYNEKITLYECVMPDGKNGIVINMELYMESQYDDDIFMNGYAIIQNDIENQICFGGVIVYADEDRVAEAQRNIEQLGFSTKSEDDYEYTALYQEEELDLRLQAMYEKYLTIVEDPYVVFTEDVDSRFASLGEYWLMDLTQDGVPEIVCIGQAKWIYIVGEQNYVALGGVSDIYQTEDPGIIIVKGGWPGEVTWDKYEVIVDVNGNIMLETLERAYMKCYDDWESGATIAEMHGEKISQEELEIEADAIATDDYRYPRLVCYSDAKFTLSAFHRFKRKLNDRVLFIVDVTPLEPIDEPREQIKWLQVKESCDYYEELIEKEEYDENGNVIAYYQYDNGWNLLHYATYEYDEAQRLQKTKWYDSKGELTHVTLYSYESVGNYVYVYYEDEGEWILSKREEYDENGIKTAEDCYSYGTQTIEARYEYDNNGNIVAWYIDGGNNELYFYEGYEYDEQGRRIKYIWEVDENLTPLGYFKYEYDESGNSVRAYDCQSNGEVIFLWENVYEREFDEEGDEIAWYEYNEEGICIAYERYTYVTE